MAQKKPSSIRNLGDRPEPMKVRTKVISLKNCLSLVSRDVPKYAQLRQALAQAIDEGYWKVGECLPKEQELTVMTPFSLGTVQRAIRALAEEGRLVRVKGRGTYVSEQPRGIAQPFLHARFLDDSGNSLLPVYPSVVSKKLIRERGPWSELLRQQGANVFRVERILSINEEFSAFSRFYINADRFPTFARKSTAELTSGNYKLMLSRDFNLPSILYEQVMELTQFPEFVVRFLDLPAATVGAVFRVIARTSPSSPVYYHELYIPPNHRQLRLPAMVLPTGR